MTTDLDARRWDLIHQKTHQDKNIHSKYAEEKEVLFPRNSLICELGGGTGDDSLYFLQKGHSVILLDISKFALDIALNKAKQANLSDKLVVQQIDFGLHALPVKENTCDVAYSRISLHYFPRDETIDLFKAIYNFLKPGGSAYLTFKSPEDKVEMEYLQENTVEFEPGVYIENGQLRSRFSKGELEEMLVSAGIDEFKVNHYEEELGTRASDHHDVLLLNEIIFTKKNIDKNASEKEGN